MFNKFAVLVSNSTLWSVYETAADVGRWQRSKFRQIRGSAWFVPGHGAIHRAPPCSATPQVRNRPILPETGAGSMC